MKVSFRKSEKELIAKIRGGNAKAMENVYLRNRSEFVSWAESKFGINYEDALDHYQDTVTIFFEQVMNGRITDVSSSVKTYLFGIGKNRIKQQFDASSRQDNHMEGLAEHYQFLAQHEDAAEAYERSRTHTQTMFEKLGDNCKEILKLFYFDKKSMSEIAKIMNHKSEAVSRTTKKRCLEKLRVGSKEPLADG